MELLLDTHALLWWLQDSEKLRPSWRKAISKPDHRVFVSAASIWEIAIKSSLGRLQLRLPSDLDPAELAEAALVVGQSDSELPLTACGGTCRTGRSAARMW